LSFVHTEPPTNTLLAVLVEAGGDARELVAGRAGLLPQAGAVVGQQRDVRLGLAVDEEVAADDDVAVLVFVDRGAERCEPLELRRRPSRRDRLGPAGEQVAVVRVELPDRQLERARADREDRLRACTRSPR
jgi:hypothetical protein